ncbi:MAG TPA: hypothetical protein VK698_39680 [Kofleriaceae bacterium]|nr:hypothetical protein [Kofleriaceae bacterium]
MTEGYKIGDWVFSEDYGRGAGEVIMDLGDGLLRAVFARAEATVRTYAVRRATDEEIAAARQVRQAREASR